MLLISMLHIDISMGHVRVFNKGNYILLAKVYYWFADKQQFLVSELRPFDYRDFLIPKNSTNKYIKMAIYQSMTSLVTHLAFELTAIDMVYEIEGTMHKPIYSHYRGNYVFGNVSGHY